MGKNLLVVLGMWFIMFSTFSHVEAETIGTYYITPASPSLERHGPTQNAHTYIGDPDIWVIDFSSFLPNNVEISLKVDDYYPPYPDDYNLYWDGILLGNTISPYNGQVFQFNTSSNTHSLTVEYVNIQPGSGVLSTGGSHYDLWLTASPTPTPVPAAVWLLGPGLLGLIGLRRKINS